MPTEAKAMVRAAVRVVFPWSTWPIVPIFTWGFFRSNFPRAARTVKAWRPQKEVAAELEEEEDGTVKGVMKEEESWGGGTSLGLR